MINWEWAMFGLGIFVMFAGLIAMLIRSINTQLKLRLEAREMAERLRIDYLNSKIENENQREPNDDHMCDSIINELKNIIGD